MQIEIERDKNIINKPNRKQKINATTTNEISNNNQFWLNILKYSIAEPKKKLNKKKKFVVVIVEIFGNGGSMSKTTNDKQEKKNDENDDDFSTIYNLISIRNCLVNACCCTCTDRDSSFSFFYLSKSVAKLFSVIK